MGEPENPTSKAPSPPRTDVIELPSARPLKDLLGSVDPTAILAEALPHLVWSARPDGFCDYLNSRYYEYTGAQPGQHLGCGWREAIHPSERIRVVKNWSKVISDGQPFEAEYRIRAADGGYCWVLARGVPIRDDAGEVVRWFGTCTDIDSQKRAQATERFLADLSDRLRPIAEPEEVMWTAVSAVGERLEVSRATYAEIDLLNEQVIVTRDYHSGVPSAAGVYPMSYFAEETIAEARAGHLVVCCNTETDPRTARRFASSYRPIQIGAFISVPVVKEGALQYILTVQSSTPRDWTEAEIALLQDVAERTTQAVLRAHLFRAAQIQAEELAFITENAPAHICRVGTDGRFIYVNASFAARFGLSPADVIGRDVADVLGKEAFDAIRPYMDRAFEGYRVSYSLDIPYKQIGVRHMLCGYAPYVDERTGSRGLVGIIQDVTDTKRAEKALSASDASLRSFFEQSP